MKKFLKGLIFAFAGVFALTLASCGEEHTAETGWNRDTTAHWHTCADEGCEEMLDYETHVWNNWVIDNAQCFETRKCDICGFSVKRTVDHTWSEFKPQEDGSLVKTCTHCGEKASVSQYYLKGAISGNSGIVWDKSEVGAFEFDQETMTSSITITLAAGDKFKVGTASGWEFNHGNVEGVAELFDKDGDGNLVCKEAADYEITVSGLEGSDHKCSVKQLCKHTYGEYALTPTTENPCLHTATCSKCQGTTTTTTHNYSKPTGTYEKCTRCAHIAPLDFYLKGSVANNTNITTSATDAGKFAVDGKVSTLIVEISKDDEFKIGSKDLTEFGFAEAKFGSDFVEGTDNNIKAKSDGIYVFTVSGLDTAEYAVSVAKYPVYVRGSMNGWGTDSAYQLAESYVSNVECLNIIVKLEKDAEFKIATPNWSTLEFGAANTTLPEGKMENKDGNIKVLETGYYQIIINPYTSKAKAKCTITLLYTSMALADVKAAEAGTGFNTVGTVKEVKEDGSVVLTDGAETPTEITVTNLGHVHVGDVVEFNGYVNVAEDVKTYKASYIVNAELSAEGKLAGKVEKVTDASQLKDGAKVFIASGNYVMSNQSGKFRTILFSVTKLDKHQAVVTLVKSGDNWLLKVGEGEYLYYSKIKEIATGNVTDDTAKWTITVENGEVTIVNVSEVTAYLQFNFQSPRVVAYANTQINPELYIYTAE